MKFCLIDKIVALEKNKFIETLKNLTMGEEYLQDHFPDFPVMPGVLMLETMVQSAVWLIRLSRNFTSTIITLDEVTNIRYGQFFVPGDQLRIRVEMEAGEGELSRFRGRGEIATGTAISGKFSLRAKTLGDLYPNLSHRDQLLRDFFRQRFKQLSE